MSQLQGQIALEQYAAGEDDYYDDDDADYADDWMDGRRRVGGRVCRGARRRRKRDVALPLPAAQAAARRDGRRRADADARAEPASSPSRRARPARRGFPVPARAVLFLALQALAWVPPQLRALARLCGSLRPRSGAAAPALPADRRRVYRRGRRPRQRRRRLLYWSAVALLAEMHSKDSKGLASLSTDLRARRALQALAVAAAGPAIVVDAILLLLAPGAEERACVLRACWAEMRRLQVAAGGDSAAPLAAICLRLLDGPVFVDHPALVDSNGLAALLWDDMDMGCDDGEEVKFRAAVQRSPILMVRPFWQPDALLPRLAHEAARQPASAGMGGGEAGGSGPHRRRRRRRRRRSKKTRGFSPTPRR